jgi:Bacterial PH domain
MSARRRPRVRIAARDERGPERAGSRGIRPWDIEVRPHLTPYFAYGAAVLIAVAGVVLGVLLKISSTGVIFQTADQVAIALLGIVIAGVVTLFARPRLRVGAAGVAVRNLFGYKLIPWSDVVGVSFPRGARWARVDLPDDEYVPVMAIQAVDKERAVDAMDRVRDLLARYRPDINSH